MRDSKGRFKEGHITWNKNVDGYTTKDTEKIAKIKATQFKEGQVPPSANPEGTISVHHKKGKIETVTINIDWQGNRKTHNTYAWYVWEVANQRDRPFGYLIYHKDRDKLNNELENLELITRAELIQLNRA